MISCVVAGMSICLCLAGGVPAELSEALAVVDYRSAVLEYELSKPDSPARAVIRNRYDGERVQYASRWNSGEEQSDLPRFLETEDVTTRLDDGWFVGNGTAISAQWHADRPPQGRLWDIRNAVTTAGPEGMLTARDQRQRQPGLDCGQEPTYTSEQRDDAWVVRAECAPGRWIEWLIRSEGTPLIERVTQYADSRPVSAIRIEWTESGGTPVPQRMHFERAEGGEMQRRGELTLLRAQFSDVPPLTPEEAGLDVGTNIDRILPDGSVETWPDTNYPRTMTWDGQGFVPWRDVMRRVTEGDLEWGTRFRRDLALSQLQREGSAGLAAPSKWRSFVQQFIQAYGLDDEQRQRAWTLHAEALQRFRDSARRIAPEGEIEAALREVRAGVEMMATTGAPVQDIAEHHAGPASEKLKEVRKLADVAFRDLVKRLYRLPTRANLRDGNDGALRQAYSEYLPPRPEKDGE